MERAGSDPDPEIAFSAAWGADVRTAREARGWTQAELGQRVGVSQNVVSLIENGRIGASSVVRPICRELGLHLPTMFENVDDETWVRLGRQLRDHDSGLFRRALDMVESMVAALDPRPRR